MLMMLSFEDNALTGPIPASFGALSNLRALDLHNNQLTGSIQHLNTMTNLFSLDLHGNQLTGPILLSGLALMRKQVAV